MVWRWMLLVWFIVLASHTAALGTTYYVATTGDNSRSCSTAQTISTPKATLMGGSGGIACLSAGDTLYLRTGTYAERISTVLQAMPSGTSWTNAITIASYPGETATLRPTSGGNAIEFSNDANVAYLIFDHLLLDLTANNSDAGGFYAGIGNHHLRLRYSELKSTRVSGGTTSAGGNAVHGGGNFIEILQNDLHDFTDYGFYVRGQNWLIDGNQIHDNGGYGVQIYRSGANDVNNNVLSNNRIYNNGIGFFITTYAVILSSGSNNIAMQNIVHGQAGGSGNGGIQVAYTNGGTNNQVYNNTITGNEGVGIDIYSSATGTVVRNNIVYNNAGGNINNAGSGTSMGTNLCTAFGAGCTTGGNPAWE